MNADATTTPNRLERIGRFGLRALRIAASTAAIVELLRSDWRGGLSAGGAWLLFVLVERRLGPVSEPAAGRPVQAQGDEPKSLP